MIVNKLIYYF